MNAKSKVFGLLAAAALSLTMFGGVMAQTSSDSEGVSTVLVNSVSLCAVDIYTYGGGFGTWQASGGAFVETSGVHTQDFSAYVTNASGGPCNVSIAFGGLTGPGGLIGTSNFSAWSWNWWGYVDPAGHSVSNVVSYWGNWWDFSYTLNSVPSTLTAGTYSGTISATVSNGA